MLIVDSIRLSPDLHHLATIGIAAHEKRLPRFLRSTSTHGTKLGVAHGTIVVTVIVLAGAADSVAVDEILLPGVSHLWRLTVDVGAHGAVRVAGDRGWRQKQLRKLIGRERFGGDALCVRVALSVGLFLASPCLASAVLHLLANFPGSCPGVRVFE